MQPLQVNRACLSLTLSHILPQSIAYSNYSDTSWLVTDYKYKFDVHGHVAADRLGEDGRHPVMWDEHSAYSDFSKVCCCAAAVMCACTAMPHAVVFVYCVRDFSSLGCYSLCTLILCEIL